MNKETTITITTSDNCVLSYIAEYPFYRGEGRMLIRDMGFGNLMVHIQEKNRDPSFSGYYSSLENAESFAKWMASGL